MVILFYANTAVVTVLNFIDSVQSVFRDVEHFLTFPTYLVSLIYQQVLVLVAIHLRENLAG